MCWELLEEYKSKHSQTKKISFKGRIFQDSPEIVAFSKLVFLHMIWVLASVSKVFPCFLAKPSLKTDHKKPYLKKKLKFIFTSWKWENSRDRIAEQAYNLFIKQGSYCLLEKSSYGYNLIKMMLIIRTQKKKKEILIPLGFSLFFFCIF